MSLKKEMKEDNYIPPKGKYPATVSLIEECKTTYGDAIKIEFTISEESEFEGKKLNIMCSDNLSPNSKLFKIISEIKPELKDTKIKEVIDIDSIIGYKVLLTTESKEGSSGTVFPKVTKIERLDNPDKTPF